MQTNSDQQYSENKIWSNQSNGTPWRGNDSRMVTFGLRSGTRKSQEFRPISEEKNTEKQIKKGDFFGECYHGQLDGRRWIVRTKMFS